MFIKKVKSENYRSDTVSRATKPSLSKKEIARDNTTFDLSLLSPLDLLENCQHGLGVLLAFLPERLCQQQLHRVLLKHAANHHSMKGPDSTDPRHCHH